MTKVNTPRLVSIRQSYRAASILAVENELSRCTESIGIDPKTNEATIVERVKFLNGETGTPIREEKYYIPARITEDVDLQHLVMAAKTFATHSFLGTTLEDTQTPTDKKLAKEAEETKQLKSPEPAEEKVTAEPESTVEDEAPKTKKPKTAGEAAKKRKTQTSTKRRATRKAQAEPVEAPVQTASIQDDDEDEEIEPVVVKSPAKKEDASNVVLFDKSKETHAQLLRPLIEARYGKSWKSDGSKRAIVRELLQSIIGKVPVTNGDGVPLKSFSTKIKGIFESVEAQNSSGLEVI